jgi:hypothetical protein
MAGGAPEARELALMLAKHCKKKLHTRGTVERTPMRERIVTGIQVSDPAYMSGSKSYLFAIRKWSLGQIVWNVRVRVTWALEVEIDAQMDAGDEAPPEVIACLHEAAASLA